MVGSLAISLAYGLPVKSRRDELVEMIDSIIRMLSIWIVPGNAIVNLIPWLKHIPAWLPGMGFKRLAKSVRWMAVRFKMEAYERAVRGFVRSTHHLTLLSLVEADSCGACRAPRVYDHPSFQMP